MAEQSVGTWIWQRLRPPRARKAWEFDPCSPDIAARVRSEIRQVLQRCGRADAIERLDIVYAELVANSIRHAPGKVQVQLECPQSGGAVVLHVKDRGPGYHAISRLPLDVLSESGRGLFIISMYSDRFVVRRRLGGGSYARIWLNPP
ncbi:MAG: ATP-binding protein [Candidatus Eremiobacteraeota bacterium]|nr:ATP-binding protein [Candidatus Eremiobacteraeota bacterium]